MAGLVLACKHELKSTPQAPNLQSLVGKCPIATRGKLACCISLAKRGMKNLPTNLWSAATPWIGWQLENRQFEFGS